MSHENEHLGTREEVLGRVESLKAEGWQVLPCNDPERALLGFCVFRYVTENTKETVQHVGEGLLEETHVHQWSLYGRPLEPEVALLEPDDLWAMIEADKNAFKCDDAKARLVGFVWYKPTEGRSIVRRVTLTKLKSDNPSAKAIMEFRGTVPEMMMPT